MSIMLKTDGTLLCDPSGATPLATTTLSLTGAMTDTVGTAVSLVTGGGANAVNGTIIQIDAERMLVVSGAPTDNLVVERGAWGTTAAIHLALAVVHLPGALTMTLLESVQVPNQSVKIRKSTPTVPSTGTLSDINFVLIQAGGTDVFPGGGTTRILPDSTETNGMVTITFPGAGDTRVLMVSGGSGAAGPPGAPGGGGTPPPSVTASGSITSYQAWSDATQPVFGGVITLPISDPNYSHLKFITVEAVSPPVAGVQSVIYLENCVFDWPFVSSGSTLPFSGTSPAVLQTNVAQPGWSLKVTPLNEYYEPGTPTLIPNNYPTTSLTIAAAEITSATVTDAVSLRWQGTDTSLCSVIKIVCGGSWLGNVCMCIDKGHGAGKEFQGWDALTYVGQPLYIGFPTAANLAPPSEIIRLTQSLGATVDDTQTTGIQHPPTTGDETWTMYLTPWSQDINDKGANSADWSSALVKTFTATSIGPVAATSVTNALFIPNPDTGDVMDYVQVGVGSYEWIFNELDWTQPTLDTDPNYWFSFPTKQKGAIIGGVWTPAPDWEGTNDDKAGSPPLYYGNQFTDSGALTVGDNSIPGTTVQCVGSFPPNWGYPPINNPDGTPNLYRTFRFLIYGVSRLGTDVNGGTGVYTLQNCWPGGADHYDLTPAAQIPAIDLTQTAPSSVKLPLAIDPGTGKPTIAIQGISEPYIAANAVSARTMAANAINAANSPTVVGALAFVDTQIAGVGLNKLGTGTTISNNVCIFTTDVVLSRGSAYPLIDLSYSGIYLYGVGGGGAGLTSQPYVAVQNTGILVSQGGSGPSVQVNGNGVTIWAANGNVNQPYSSFTPNATFFRAGAYVTQVSAAGGLVMQHTATSEAIDAQIQIYIDPLYGPQITLQTSAGTLLTANSTGLTLAPGTVLVSPVVTVTGGTFTINLDSTNGFKVTGGGLVTTLSNKYSSEINVYVGLDTRNGSNQFAVVAPRAFRFGTTGSITYAGNYGMDGFGNPILYMAASNVLSDYAAIQWVSGSPQLTLNGNKVVSTRVATTPATLADVISVLQHHGLSN
jgi:hypothetical protein